MLSVPRVIIVQITESAVFVFIVILIHHIIVRQVSPHPFFVIDQAAAV